jgi:hypothetical protein
VYTFFNGFPKQFCITNDGISMPDAFRSEVGHRITNVFAPPQLACMNRDVEAKFLRATKSWLMQATVLLQVHLACCTINADNCTRKICASLVG